MQVGICLGWRVPYLSYQRTKPFPKKIDKTLLAAGFPNCLSPVGVPLHQDARTSSAASHSLSLLRQHSFPIITVRYRARKHSTNVNAHPGAPNRGRLHVYATRVAESLINDVSPAV